MLDIVISTLNEEGYIGELLTSLQKQTFKDFTVYLSDGSSTDKTVEIARQFTQSFPLKILVDSQRGLAHQRNVGGKAGISDEILFLDADVILPPHFLMKLMKNVKRNDLINCWISPLSKKPIDTILFLLYNLLALEVVRYFWPVGIGGCLYTKRKIFTDLNGFKEELAIWEDVDFIKRAGDAGAKFAILRRPTVYLSTRRFEVEGRVTYIIQMLKGLSYAITTGKIPSKEHIYYPMDLEYSKLLKRKKYSKRKITSLLQSYTTYFTVLKKIRSMSVDTAFSNSVLHQLLTLPLIKRHKTRIERVLRISQDKKSG